MDSHALIKSLLDDVSKLPHKDDGKLDLLLKRAKMVITKVFSGSSQYLTDWIQFIFIRKLHIAE